MISSALERLRAAVGTDGLTQRYRTTPHRNQIKRQNRRFCAIQKASFDACAFTPIIQFWTSAVEWRALFPVGQS